MPECQRCKKKINKQEFDSFGRYCARCDELIFESMQDAMYDVAPDEIEAFY
jgi:hypothetical protein